jgi:hypothetical protein
VDQLAAELTELARMAPDRMSDRIAALSVRDQADLALRLPAKQRLELLLHAPKPMRLVRALPDGDLYLTLREIGPADAMPVLKLASAEQIHHLFDLESWRHDRFDAKRAGAWVALVLEAGEPALKRFLRTADDEVLALLFQQWLRIEQMEYEETGTAEKHGHGMTEMGTGKAFVTPDGGYRFSPTISEHAPAIRRMLQLFYELQPERYLSTLWAAQWELPSELEEKALHWRQSRLEEHGFLPREEALNVYAPPSGVTAHPEPPDAIDADGLSSSRLALTTPTGEARLAPLIDAMADPVRERVLHEIASLANRLLVADAGDSGDPAAHRAALSKAAAFVGVAMMLRGAGEPARAGRLLEEVPLLELFREGYAEVTELQYRARALVRSGWASRDARALELLDSPVLERVRALLEPPPRFVEVEAESQVGESREFRTLAEIRETGVSLELAEVVGDLLIRRLDLEIAVAGRAGASQTGQAPRFSSLFLTLLAWHAVRGELRGAPLPQELLADFLRNVASRRTASPEAPQRALELLLRALAERLELDSRSFAVLQAFGRFCLKRLAEECAGLDPGIPVDRRYVSSLLIAD